MAGASSEPQHCWGLERVPRDFEGPTYILQNAQVGGLSCLKTHGWLVGSQEEISVGRNRKSNVKVCDGPNVSRNHLKLVRWEQVGCCGNSEASKNTIVKISQEWRRHRLEIRAMDGEGLGRPKRDVCQQVVIEFTHIHNIAKLSIVNKVVINNTDKCFSL